MKKNILLITAESNFSYSNPNSAVANYLITLKDGMESEGFHVALFPNEIANEHKKINVEKKTGSNLIKQILKKIVPSVYYSFLVRKKVHYAKRAEEQITNGNFNFDLVIEFLSLGSMVSSEIKKIKGVPYIIIYDAPILTQFREMHATNSLLKNEIENCEKESLENANTIICYSPSVTDYLQKNFKLKANLVELPCIVWKEEISPDKDKKQIIGFIGSFLKWHKVELLVRAFEKIADDFPEARLVLLGYGQQWNDVNEMVLKSPIKNRIEMPGYVDEGQLKKWKREFLIGVMPGSNWYGSPLKLFEYAQASIAIIAPQTPVVSDLFTYEEVLFIDPKNELNSLVENLKKMLTDEEFRNGLIERSSNKMQTIYSKSQQLNKFNQIIANTLKNGIEE